MASGGAEQDAGPRTASRTSFTLATADRILAKAASRECRLPSGHPEAFFEAFANVYTAAYDDMIKRATGQKFEKVNTIYPNVYDGVEGMYFIQQAATTHPNPRPRHHHARKRGRSSGDSGRGWSRDGASSLRLSAPRPWAATAQRPCR